MQILQRKALWKYIEKIGKCHFQYLTLQLANKEQAAAVLHGMGQNGVEGHSLPRARTHSYGDKREEGLPSMEMLTNLRLIKELRSMGFYLGLFGTQ